MNVSRREFLKSSAVTALIAGLPAGWAGGVYAADGPETPKVRIGIIALTDCSSIVMAHELGLFKKHGIESTVSKEASWPVIRDRLTLGALTRMELQDQLVSLRETTRKTVIMVTHDVDEALLLADRVVMMTSGPAVPIGEILDVPFPRSRRREDLIDRPDYFWLRDSIIGFLVAGIHA